MLFEVTRLHSCSFRSGSLVWSQFYIRGRFDIRRMLQKVVYGELTIDLNNKEHEDLTLVNPLTSVIIEAQEKAKLPNALKRMVLYLLDIIFKEFEPLLYKEPNLCQRLDNIPKLPIIQNRFRFHQDLENLRRKKIYDAKRANQKQKDENGDAYSAEDMEFQHADLRFQNNHCAKKGVTPRMMVISYEHKLLLGK